ncbi:hypothetical protein GCM10027258_62680 [Amycolatopsis stemonae]
MKPTKIPDHAAALWPNGQRVTIGPPPDDTTGQIAAVEAVLWRSEVGGMPVRSIRCEFEPGELADLARGGHVWLSIYGGIFPPFAVQVAPDTDPDTELATDPEAPAEPPSKRLGLIEAVLRTHLGIFDSDWVDHDTGKPLQVIRDDQLPHILGEIARGWNAPAFRDAGEEDAGGG